MKVEIPLYQPKWEEPIEGGMVLSLSDEGRLVIDVPGEGRHRALYVEPKDLLVAVQALTYRDTP